jgi:hypothetical protein
MSTSTLTSPVQLSGETPELTIRVNIEFAVATLPAGVEDPEPKDPRQVYNITKEDNQMVKPHSYPDDTEFLEHVENTLVSVGFPQSIGDLKTIGDDTIFVTTHLNWDVTSCSLFNPPLYKVTTDPKAYRYNTCEVKSPILPYGPDSLKSITEALNTLGNTYRMMDNDLVYHDRFSQRAGSPVRSLKLEVRYGNETFPDRTLKNLLAILWTFEQLLDTMHPSYMLNTDATLKLRGNCELSWEMAKLVEGRKPPTAADALVKIFACSTAEEVIDLALHGDPWWMQIYWTKCFPIKEYPERVGDPAYPNYKLRESKVSEPINYPTVTFNGHESTFERARFQSWIKVCIGLVNFAHRADLESLKDWLLSHTKEVEADAVGDAARDLAEKLTTAGGAKHDVLKKWLDEYTKSLNKEKVDDVGDLASDLEKKLTHSEVKEYTVIELLKDIGLPDQAEYYEGKTFVHDYNLID